MSLDNTLRERASEWVVRVGDPAFDDWDAFTRWLSEDPAHARAYDRIAGAVADAVEAESRSPIVHDEPALPHAGRRAWIGGAIAASLAAVLAVGFWQFGEDRYVIETAPGEIRTIALGDGDRIALGGGTRLELDHDDRRFASLDKGQALFMIRHDETHPFKLKLGEDTVLDTGTVFDARRDGDGISVAVAEGSVTFNPGDQNVTLVRGELVSRTAGSSNLVLSHIPVEQVGEWRDGRITFRAASLGEIADRLRRATGVPYRAATGDPATYSGSILIAPLRNEPQLLGDLLGVRVSATADGWVIAGR